MSAKQPVVVAAAEWIIQRCTQRWHRRNGILELIYEDVPGLPLMTRPEMVAALERRDDVRSPEYSSDEFRGHNVANCRCPEHATHKGLAA
jgi:hypothetical protein